MTASPVPLPPEDWRRSQHLRWHVARESLPAEVRRRRERRNSAGADGTPQTGPDQCWSCAREAAVCRSKISHADPVDAQEWADEHNEATGYAAAVYVYACSWDGPLHWHTATARTPSDRRRVERRRRMILRGRAAG